MILLWKRNQKLSNKKCLNEWERKRRIKWRFLSLLPSAKQMGMGIRRPACVLYELPWHLCRFCPAQRLRAYAILMFLSYTRFCDCVTMYNKRCVEKGIVWKVFLPWNGEYWKGNSFKVHNIKWERNEGNEEPREHRKGYIWKGIFSSRRCFGDKRERERERAERTERGVYLKRNMFEAVNNKRNFDEEGRINRSKGSKNWNV